uniref:Secreted protein n=1 Tax=Eutreptiella gymnastica TaxID=73025 RepID=A0A7S4LIK8_9EUGL
MRSVHSGLHCCLFCCVYRVCVCVCVGALVWVCVPARGAKGCVVFRSGRGSHQECDKECNCCLHRFNGLQLPYFFFLFPAVFSCLRQRFCQNTPQRIIPAEATMMQSKHQGCH